MSEPRVITPEEARPWVETTHWWVRDLAYTVATEDDRWAQRIAAAERAAVVKVLRGFGLKYAADWALVEADVIKNGAPL